MPTIAKPRENILMGVVGGLPPQTLAATLYCAPEGRYRRFAFKELRSLKDCPGIVAELYACTECRWTRQWGARTS